MLAWCSSQLMTISSPAPTWRRPQLWATRLMASVVPRANTMFFDDGAFRKRRTVSRAPSYASVARAASVCAARWMFEFSCS